MLISILNRSLYLQFYILILLIILQFELKLFFLSVSVKAIITPDAIRDFFIETLVDNLPMGQFINSKVQHHNHHNSHHPHTRSSQAKNKKQFYNDVILSPLSSSSSKWNRTLEDLTNIDSIGLVSSSATAAASAASSAASLAFANDANVKHSKRQTPDYPWEVEKKAKSINDANGNDDYGHFGLTEDANEWGKFHIDEHTKCDKNIWSEKLVHTVNRQMKWFINEPNIKNKTVIFR